MAKPKRKLTSAERRAKRERKEKYMRIFINGKQKWVRRPPQIEGLDVHEFIARNADPIWLHQNGMWEFMPAIDEDEPQLPPSRHDVMADGSDDEDSKSPF